MNRRRKDGRVNVELAQVKPIDKYKISCIFQRMKCHVMVNCFMFSRLVHLDLKGAPPRTCYFEKVHIIEERFVLLPCYRNLELILFIFRAYFARKRRRIISQQALLFENKNCAIIFVFFLLQAIVRVEL